MGLEQALPGEGEAARCRLVSWWAKMSGCRCVCPSGRANREQLLTPGQFCGERETEAVGGRLKAGRADREGTNREGAERETREGAGGAKREKRREERQLGGRGQASRPPGSFKGSNFLVDG